MKKRIQILIVSDQAAPNLLPALDRDLKPDEALLLVSEKMRAKSKNLEVVLKREGVKVRFENIPNELDFQKMEECLCALSDQLKDYCVELNVTGGTKLMVLAAYSIAQVAEWAIFYVDMGTDQVIWLHKNPDQKHKQLSENLRLRHYLLGYGFELLKPKIIRKDSSCDKLIDNLLSKIDDQKLFFGRLNWIVQEAKNKQDLSFYLEKEDNNAYLLESVLQSFADAKKIKFDGRKIDFLSEEDLKFVQGGWLEYYVYHVVDHLVGELGICDKGANIEVTDENGVKNELDVAFMARNRLFIIECKTARMDKKEIPKANDALFKLSEVRKRVGGLGAKAMLASYRPLSKAEKDLAKALNIKLVTGHDLKRLKEKVKEWVNEY